MNQQEYPLVSIGIPTYNRADQLLGEALQSALDQTYESIEIIVSDNCSNDNTEAFVKGFSDKRIRYFKQAQNVGVNNNFNACLKYAKGDYFLLLHDDDCIDKDFVETCMQRAGYSTDFGIIRTGTRVINEYTEVTNESFNQVANLPIDEFFIGWFHEKTSFYFCSTLFNTARLREIGGFQSKYDLVQDGMAITLLAAKYKRIDIKEIKASFRKHSSEMTHAVKIKYWCRDFLNLLDLMCSVSGTNSFIVRSEGKRFYAKICYRFAASISPSYKRYIAYLFVFKEFRFRYLPPPVRRLIHNIVYYLRRK